MTLFRLFAGTDIGLRDNNEDNFTVNPDLTLDEWMVPADQQATIQLGKRGCLMVVADGMGGMNAGEVASDIAIKTVQELFSPSRMPDNVVERHESIKDYLKKTIVEADRQVKKHCKKDPTTEGMGSTIVVAWLVNSLAYAGWLGDSRAYSFVPGKGIQRLSKDHSYVQELVDAKKITEEEAMLHPQSNVIMRSLGDATQKAKPGIICHPIVKGEILLLCSDGLCGVCDDALIAEIISNTSSDLRNCKETLTNAALDAEGSDNITISLLQIVDAPMPAVVEETENSNMIPPRLLGNNVIIVVFFLFLVCALLFAGIKILKTPQQKKDDRQMVDSIRNPMVDSHLSKTKDSVGYKEVDSVKTVKVVPLPVKNTNIITQTVYNNDSGKLNNKKTDSLKSRPVLVKDKKPGKLKLIN